MNKRRRTEEDEAAADGGRISLPEHMVQSMLQHLLRDNARLRSQVDRCESEHHHERSAQPTTGNSTALLDNQTSDSNAIENDHFGADHIKDINNAVVRFQERWNHDGKDRAEYGYDNLICMLADTTTEMNNSLKLLPAKILRWFLTICAERVRLNLFVPKDKVEWESSMAYFEDRIYGWGLMTGNLKFLESVAQEASAFDVKSYSICGGP